MGTYTERYMDLDTPEDNEAGYNVSYWAFFPIDHNIYKLFTATQNNKYLCKKTLSDSYNILSPRVEVSLFFISVLDIDLFVFIRVFPYFIQSTLAWLFICIDFVVYFNIKLSYFA